MMEAMGATVHAFWYLWLAMLVSSGVAVACLLLVALYAEKTRHRYSVMIQSSRRERK